MSYNENMKKENLVEYFEEVETTQEYNGYFCSIPEAISIVDWEASADCTM